MNRKKTQIRGTNRKLRTLFAAGRRGNPIDVRKWLEDAVDASTASSEVATLQIHIWFSRLAQLVKTGDGSACRSLAELATEFTRTLNQCAIQEPEHFQEFTPSLMQWPVLKSPVPAYSFPTETKPVSLRLTRPAPHRRTDLNRDTLLDEILRVGQDHALTSRGKYTKAKTSDLLGHWAIQILSEIEKLRGARVPFPPSAEVYNLVQQLPPLTKPLTALQIDEWANAARIWAKKTRTARELNKFKSMLVVSRAHQNRPSTLLDKLATKVRSLLGGKKV